LLTQPLQGIFFKLIYEYVPFAYQSYSCFNRRHIVGPVVSNGAKKGGA